MHNKMRFLYADETGNDSNDKDADKMYQFVKLLTMISKWSNGSFSHCLSWFPLENCGNAKQGSFDCSSSDDL